MLRLFTELAEGHLVRAPGPFHLLPVHHLRSSPALRGPEDQHGPARTVCLSLFPSPFLDTPDIGEYLVQRRGHLLVHRKGVVPFEVVRRVSVSHKQRLQFFL